jgi:hypothetical protein
MWYKEAYKQFNIYGLPVAEFADEQTEVDEDLEVEPNNAPEITIDDPTPEDEFTPEDLQQNIQTLEQDPTVNLKLPPLHNLEDPGCYCKIENRPLLSYPGVRDALRVWVVNHFRDDGSRINNCLICIESAKDFNEKEIIRLRNKGIDVNPIA